MNAASLLYLPDAAAMLVLMSVLLSLRGQSRAKDVTLWLTGLSFILLEALSSDVYRADKAFFPSAMHILALAAYVLAGLTFAWVARRNSFPRRAYGSLCLTATLPLLALAALYGAGNHSIRAYTIAVAAAMLAQCVCIACVVRRPRILLLVLALEAGGWGPVLFLVLHAEFRAATYWGIGYLYLLVACALWSLVARSRIGGTIVVAGFAVWAACLLAHPYVAPASLANSLWDQVWTMQKFFVTIGLLLVLLDEERRHNRELALYDSLTGLPNRRLFDDRLSQAVERTNRSALPFALFVIDLDQFKSINDRLGHAQGDLVLCQAAAALSSVVRSSDTLARCGGDEFTVIVNEIANPQTCDRIAAQLRGSLERTTVPNPSLKGRPLTLSGSVGYALYPTDAPGREALQQLADQRMYQQKSPGNRSAAPPVTPFIKTA